MPDKGNQQQQQQQQGHGCEGCTGQHQAQQQPDEEGASCGWLLLTGSEDGTLRLLGVPARSPAADQPFLAVFAQSITRHAEGKLDVHVQIKL